MIIDKTLLWRQHASDFDTEQKKILLALSSRKWLWWTFDNLRRVTRLSDDELTPALGELLEQGLVKGSVSRRAREAIFGLSERTSETRLTQRPGKR